MKICPFQFVGNSIKNTTQNVDKYWIVTIITAAYHMEQLTHIRISKKAPKRGFFLIFFFVPKEIFLGRIVRPDLFYTLVCFFFFFFNSL